jgi:hypothetical protein
MRDEIADRDLERTLAEIGQRLDYPRRDLWPAVRTRIATGRVPWWRAFTPRLALAPAATLAILLAAVLALSPEVRARAAEVLGIRGIQIFPVTSTPTVQPSAGAEVFTGRRVAMAEASSAAGFTVRAPAALGTPDAVYVESVGSATRVTLVYASRPGIPVSPHAGVSAAVVEFRGTLDQVIIGKVVGPGTTVDPVTVNGGAGYWLAGEPHQFFYRDASGTVLPETLRLAGNTLLWEADGVTYRLEANVSKDEALRIASTLR